jgi:hypothetical protein
MQEFARLQREQIDKIPTLFSREWRGFVITIERFAAEIDRAFKFSERMARGLRAISDMIERWRGHIATVKAFVDSLGDLSSVVNALTVTLLAVGASSAVISQLVFWFAIFASKVLAVAAAFLFIEDFFAWIQGKDSIIGDLAGSFDDVQKAVLAQFPWLEQLKQWFLDFQAMQAEGKLLSFGGSAAEIERILALLGQVKALFAAEGFLSVEGSIKEFERLYQILSTIGYYVAGGFKLAWDGIVASIRAIADAIGWLDRQFQKFRENIEAQRGPSLGDPGGGAGLNIVPQPQSLQMPQMAPGAVISPAAAAGAPVQNNDIRIEVPVTATGASGAEVAAGARSGVAQAARDMVSDLGGVARGLSMSMPLSETAAA